MFKNALSLVWKSYKKTMPCARVHQLISEPQLEKWDEFSIGHKTSDHCESRIYAYPDELVFVLFILCSLLEPFEDFITTLSYGVH